MFDTVVKKRQNLKILNELEKEEITEQQTNKYKGNSYRNT